VILLTPGPVNISERVRKTLLRPDIGYRESEFAELIQGIRRKLLQAFVPGAEADYTAIVLTASGSAAIESSLVSSLPHGKRALVINNGPCGELIASIVSIHRLGVAEFKLEWGTKPDPEKLRLALRQHPEVHVVAMVQHDTGTGQMNPVKEMAEVADSQNRAFLVDAVGSLGGEPLDIAGPHIYMVAGSAHMGIQGVPGVSFVLVRKGFMERMKGYLKRSWYLHLPHYYEDEERGRIPFTPAPQVYAALDEALTELLEEGVANRVQRYKQAGVTIRAKLSALGMTPFLQPELQSNSLTAYHLPPGLTYQTLHDRLKERGYVIAPGDGPLESKVFRVANMGALTQQHLDGFLAAFQQVLEMAPTAP
jgi:2-aminoethylphosphonate-pyruvate transaminase